MIGRVDFDVNGNGTFDSSEPTAATNRKGEFGQGASDRLFTGDSGPPADAGAALSGRGFDGSSGFAYTQLRAPKNARIISPLTTIIRSEVDADVASATGLDVGPVTLISFDAAQQFGDPSSANPRLARAITELNLKLIAYAGLFANNGSMDEAFDMAAGLQPVQSLFSGPGEKDLNKKSVALDIIGRSRIAAFSTPELRDAAAELMAEYGQAVSVYLKDPASAARVQYGLRFYVLPEIDAMLRTSSLALGERVRRITVSDITAAFDAYADAPRPAAAGRFFPVADYRSLSRPRQVREIVLSGCGTGDRSPVCNDIYFFSGPDVQSSYSLTSVSLPPAFAASMDVALLPNGGIRIRRLSDEVRFAYFDYQVRAANGETATSRVFVRLGDEI
nr:hypothetical protein [uncultured Sphingosinicella sp.]